jgi:hypothetical protein
MEKENLRSMVVLGLNSYLIFEIQYKKDANQMFMNKNLNFLRICDRNGQL